jgi:hypothetical protein
MFLSHFSLNEHPFMEHPPTGWLMRDPRFDEALAGLQFFEQQGSIGLILGQTGIGKSSLLRLFMHELPQNRYQPLYLHLTPINANAFLRLMVASLGEKPRIGKDRMLLQILDRINQNEKDTLLIIDEAHLIDPKTLTDLRVLISPLGERIHLKSFCAARKIYATYSSAPPMPISFTGLRSGSSSSHTRRIKPSNISTTGSQRPVAQPKSSNRRPLPSSMIMPRGSLGRSITLPRHVCSPQPRKTCKKSTTPWSTTP